MATGRVFTGCRAKFQLNGVTVGYATGVTVREAVTFEPVKVLDSIQTKEHAPTDYDVSLTADFVKLVGESLKKAQWLPKTGKTAQEHLNNLVGSGALSAVIQDNVTKQIVVQVEGVRIAESNINITARGIVGNNVSMVAIVAKDEGDLE